MYPEELCYRILVGLLNQMQRDGRLQSGHIGAMGPEDEAQAWDDQTGEELDPSMV